MGVGYNPKAVTSGLVIYLDAANRKSYRGSGTIINDLSNKSNIGTLINTPTYSFINKGRLKVYNNYYFYDFKIIKLFSKF